MGIRGSRWRHISGATRSATGTPIVKGAVASGATARPHRSDRSSPINSASTTWPATCGNGYRIATMVTTMERLQMIRRGPAEIAISVLGRAEVPWREVGNCSAPPRQRYRMVTPRRGVRPLWVQFPHTSQNRWRRRIFTTGEANGPSKHIATNPLAQTAASNLRFGMDQATARRWDSTGTRTTADRGRPYAAHPTGSRDPPGDHKPGPRRCRWRAIARPRLGRDPTPASPTWS
jgi:hypothetical protein